MSGPLLTLYIGWSSWAVLWIGAAWWTSRTERRPNRSEEVVHKLLTFVGMAALLVVTRPQGAIFAPLWRLDRGIEWAMVAVMGLGFATACWARLSLGSLWSVRVERKQDHQLIERGPYAFVRHPIYTGLIAAGLATAFVKATPLAVAGFILMGAGLTIKARLEERFLAAELGKGSYENYCRRVPMLVPFMPLINSTISR